MIALSIKTIDLLRKLKKIIVINLRQSLILFSFFDTPESNQWCSLALSSLSTVGYTVSLLGNETPMLYLENACRWVARRLLLPCRLKIVLLSCSKQSGRILCKEHPCFGTYSRHSWSNFGHRRSNYSTCWRSADVVSCSRSSTLSRVYFS